MKKPRKPKLPTKPVMPKEPRKISSLTKYVPLYEGTSLFEVLSEVLDPLELEPIKEKVENIYIGIDPGFDKYDSEEYYFKWSTSRPNPRYDLEYKKYLKRLEKYNERIIDYKNKMESMKSKLTQYEMDMKAWEKYKLDKEIKDLKKKRERLNSQ